jgi:hypothetical protein
MQAPMTIDDCIETVNSILAILRQNAERQPLSASGHWVPKIEAVVQFLSEQKRLAAPIPRALGDLSDIPDELLRELSIPKTDELDDQILTVMRACGGETGLDQVLVGLYRKYKVVQTRRFIQNKMYRMSKKELIYQVPGHRAAYSLEPQPATTGQPNGYDDSHNERSGSFRRDELDDEIPF